MGEHGSGGGGGGGHRAGLRMERFARGGDRGEVGAQGRS